MKRWIPFVKSAPTVAVVRLSGVIAAGNRPGMLNDVTLAPVLEKAFKRGKPDAVALLINSPGGSPAQSSLIAHRIRRLSAETDVPVYAFVEDVAASGGYYLAVAADTIWLDHHSIAGSIGVISSGFGFQDLIARYGVERRVHTAGRSKSFLDPFQAEKSDDVARLKQLQEQIHATFIGFVTERRGARLSDNPDLFTGEVWIGQGAVDAGLADGVAHLEPKMKEIFGDKVGFNRYTLRRSLFQRFGAQMLHGAGDLIEERALCARYGL
ncbi:S49 family peptidase [Actibacterium ureilyticum]|uniref:S49 family peptidase n=1 Tax=Actibacterium ureilyticum TaxID=1590614 RepID=UPI000BAB03B4|nr:S49 family peptidase [Actibacterium ureilyticum]